MPIIIYSQRMLSLLTETRYPPRSLTHGIKRQQQHFQMMMMAEEIVRLMVVKKTSAEILTEAMAFVKVSHDLPSANEQ